MRNYSMLEYKKHGIYLAKVHFEDIKDIYKVRPVLIIDEKILSVLALKMTSKVGKNRDEFVLQKWKQYNLNVPTSILLDKEYRIKKKHIFHDKFLSVLDTDDIEAIEELLSE